VKCGQEGGIVFTQLLPIQWSSGGIQQNKVTSSPPLFLEPAACKLTTPPSPQVMMEKGVKMRMGSGGFRSE
jgi:hypothetical protein